MVRKILSVTDPRLRQVSRPVVKVDKKLVKLIADLKDTLLAQKEPEGMGLAAPQIGKPLRVFLVKSKDKVITFINPRITAKSDKNAYKKPKAKPKKKNYIMEGCLSLPYYYGPVKRASSIEVEYQTPDEADSQKLKNCRQRFTGFVAQIIQHEIDHLDGKVFIDRLLEQGQRLFKEEGGQLLEVEI